MPSRPLRKHTGVAAFSRHKAPFRSLEANEETRDVDGRRQRDERSDVYSIIRRTVIDRSGRDIVAFTGHTPLFGCPWIENEIG